MGEVVLFFCILLVCIYGVLFVCSLGALFKSFDGYVLCIMYLVICVGGGVFGGVGFRGVGMIWGGVARNSTIN